MENFNTLESSRRPTAIETFLSRFDRRTVMIGVALGGIGAAMYFGWDWLAAAGLTSLIIGFLPCAAMCGLGLCASRMGKGGKGSCSGKPGDAPSERPAANAEPTPK
ncbi:MAG: hypothetical protein M3Z29_00425 [Pseudomonadota bacterium]|nr:hypothetical protein [Pseudomonadota bacterium]